MADDHDQEVGHTMSFTRAQGIHDHPELKLGLRAPTGAAALPIGDYFTGILPKVPVAVDHFKSVTFGMYGNDQYGVCGPTAAANLCRLLSKGLLGKQASPSQEDVFDLYRRSGNPNFDPTTGEDDNGVAMQVMLDAMIAGGIGGVKPICFGRIDIRNDALIDAGVAILGGLLHGVNLEVAQQAQSQGRNPLWDYRAPHQPWGGHAIMNGKYFGVGQQPVRVRGGEISWEKEIDTTPLFRRTQLSEVWAVVFPWHLEHPAFLAGVDIEGLGRDYKALTGRPLPVPKKVVKAADKLQTEVKDGEI